MARREQRGTIRRGTWPEGTRVQLRRDIDRFRTLDAAEAVPAGSPGSTVGDDTRWGGRYIQVRFDAEPEIIRMVERDHLVQIEGSNR